MLSGHFHYNWSHRRSLSLSSWPSIVVVIIVNRSHHHHLSRSSESLSSIVVNRCLHQWSLSRCLHHHNDLTIISIIIDYHHRRRSLWLSSPSLVTINTTIYHHGQPLSSHHWKVISMTHLYHLSAWLRGHGLIQAIHNALSLRYCDLLIWGVTSNIITINLMNSLLN